MVELSFKPLLLHLMLAIGRREKGMGVALNGVCVLEVATTVCAELNLA